MQDDGKAYCRLVRFKLAPWHIEFDLMRPTRRRWIAGESWGFQSRTRAEKVALNRVRKRKMWAMTPLWLTGKVNYKTVKIIWSEIATCSGCAKNKLVDQNKCLAAAIVVHYGSYTELPTVRGKIISIIYQDSKNSSKVNINMFCDDVKSTDHHHHHHNCTYACLKWKMWREARGCAEHLNIVILVWIRFLDRPWWFWSIYFEKNSCSVDWSKTTYILHLRSSPYSAIL